MQVVNSVLGILKTVDFENFLSLIELVENMVYTIETNKGEDMGEEVKILEAPEDCDFPFVVALRIFEPIVETLQTAVLKVERADDTIYDILTEGLDGIGSSEEDEYPDPPDAFTDFFKGGDEDE
jgi:hypothetical protein